MVGGRGPGDWPQAPGALADRFPLGYTSPSPHVPWAYYPYVWPYEQQHTLPQDNTGFACLAGLLPDIIPPAPSRLPGNIKEAGPEDDPNFVCHSPVIDRKLTPKHHRNPVSMG